MSIFVFFPSLFNPLSSNKERILVHCCCIRKAYWNAFNGVTHHLFTFCVSGTCGLQGSSEPMRFTADEDQNAKKSEITTKKLIIGKVTTDTVIILIYRMLLYILQLSPQDDVYLLKLL